jgi:hypothetical protein
LRTIVAVLLLVTATSAEAQSSKAEAESLFRQGKDLMAQGKIAEACAAFHESQKLEPTVATLLNEANCREKNGQIATAWGLFLEAERQTRNSSDTETRSLHKVALDRSGKLEPRVSKLTISVSAESRIDRLEVVRGAETLGEASWNRALPIDGGTYKIVARAPGAAPWSTEIVIAPEGDTKTVDIPKLETAAPAPHRTDVVERPRPARRASRAPLALGAGAVVLLGGAFGADRWARSTYDRAEAEPDPARQDSLWRSANTRRYAADGLAVAGLGCAGVAVWLYLRGRGESAATATATRGKTWIIEPIAARGGAGIGITARYR